MLTALCSASRLPRMLPGLHNFSTGITGLSDLITRDVDVPLGYEEYERVVEVKHNRSRLHAIFAIHSTQLGPALGGLRVKRYKTPKDALKDVLRLAEGMSYKSALAELGLGGGKSVIISDPQDVTPEMLKVYATFLNSLGGKYITAEDSGSTVEMMRVIGEHTPYVTGLSHEKSSGDPSPWTALGVLRAIQATSQFLYGNKSVKGKKVAIQGLGNVGSSLAKLLFSEGAQLVVADIDPKKTEAMVQEYGATSCLHEEIHKQKCDIFAPCALGGILNQETIPELQCEMIVGCANNQLSDALAAKLLQQEKPKILYIPDFIANAGGIKNISSELTQTGYNRDDAERKVDKTYRTVLGLCEDAKRNGITTHEAAISLAKHLIANRIGRRTEPPYFHHFPFPRDMECI